MDRHSDPLLGLHMGSYRLIRPLGSGGGATIYLGEHRLMKDTYAAIKIPKNHFSHEEILQFCNEASTLFCMVHPHIIRVLDFGVEGNTPFLVMDYAPNGTLRQRHPKGQQVPLEIIIPYVKQIASALQYAHDHRFIHRDIKPENLLVGRSDEVLLTDFGIAIRAHRPISQSLQRPSGTPIYMAPEQWEGKACPASDQYALGIVVYEWLSGQLPFLGDRTVVFLYQHLHHPLPPLHTLLPDVPPAVEQVVQRALEKKPEDRFPTVQDFATALEEASRPAPPAPLADPPVASQALVPVAPAQQRATRHSTLWNSTYWLNLGMGMLITGVLAIMFSGTMPLTLGSIIGSALTGLGILVAWVSTRLT
jgi:serine/threonine protein kinase